MPTAAPAPVAGMLAATAAAAVPAIVAVAVIA
jgi:hypothetical protein